MILRKGDKGYDVKIIQEYLTKLGYNTNGVDGSFGNGTHNAVLQFQKDFGLTQDGLVGNGTASRLVGYYWIYGYTWHTLSSLQNGDLPWMEEAFKDYFVSEIKGEKHNPRILQMWKDAKLGGIVDDETAYCSGAVSAWLERAGIRSQRTAWARNYVNQGVEITEPKFGAIVVFSRGNAGHVGFITGKTSDGKQVRVLGSNQSDSTNERMFDVERVIAYRNPNPDIILPEAPIIGSDVTSKNEA
jgi:uncharacterized protein (TIGR02594 family)